MSLSHFLIIARVVARRQFSTAFQHDMMTYLLIFARYFIIMNKKTYDNMVIKKDSVFTSPFVHV